jgi:hypothetical protein
MTRFLWHCTCPYNLWIHTWGPGAQDTKLVKPGKMEGVELDRCFWNSAPFVARQFPRSTTLVAVAFWTADISKLGEPRQNNRWRLHGHTHTAHMEHMVRFLYACTHAGSRSVNDRWCLRIAVCTMNLAFRVLSDETSEGAWFSGRLPWAESEVQWQCMKDRVRAKYTAIDHGGMAHGSWSKKLRWKARWTEEPRTVNSAHRHNSLKQHGRQVHSRQECTHNYTNLFDFLRALHAHRCHVQTEEGRSLARLIGPSVKASKQEYTSQSKSLSVSPSGDDHTSDSLASFAQKCSRINL